MEGNQVIRTLEENLTRLEEFRMLQKDWNGYGANPIPFAAIDKAISIVKRLAIQPEIFPTGRETVQLEWDSNYGDYLEFEIGTDEIGMLFVPNSDYHVSTEREAITERELFEEAERFFDEKRRRSCTAVPVSVLRKLLEKVPQDAMVLLNETPSSIAPLLHLESKKFFGKDAVFFCGYIDDKN